MKKLLLFIALISSSIVFINESFAGNFNCKDVQGKVITTFVQWSQYRQYSIIATNDNRRLLLQTQPFIDLEYAHLWLSTIYNKRIYFEKITYSKELSTTFFQLGDSVKIKMKLVNWVCNVSSIE
jgi:hypothetical protein